MVGSANKNDLITGDEAIVVEDMSTWRYALKVNRFFSRAKRSEGAIVGTGEGGEESWLPRAEAGVSTGVDVLLTVGLRGTRELT